MKSILLSLLMGLAIALTIISINESILENTKDYLSTPEIPLN